MEILQHLQKIQNPDILEQSFLSMIENVNKTMTKVQEVTIQYTEFIKTINEQNCHNAQMMTLTQESVAKNTEFMSLIYEKLCKKHTHNRLSNNSAKNNTLLPIEEYLAKIAEDDDLSPHHITPKKHSCKGCDKNYQNTYHDEDPVKNAMYLKENRHIWHKVARQEQLLPSGNWKTWLLTAGRGFGKTRAAAENIVDLILSGKAHRIGLIGSTLLAVKSVMIEGDSGILTALQNRNIPMEYLTYTYLQSRNKLEIQFNFQGEHRKVVLFAFNGERYNLLRGYEFDHVWIDEWLRFSNANELYNQVQLCLRCGKSRCIITTTPVHNHNDNLLTLFKKDESVHITNGPSMNNCGLSDNFMEYADDYRETRQGQREINGHVEMTQSWTSDSFIRGEAPEHCDIYRVGIDMAVGKGLIGMVLVGLKNNITYVLEDFSTYENDWLENLKRISEKYYPLEIIYESNQGGNLIGSLIFSAGIRCNMIDVFANSAKKERHYVLFMHYLYKKVIHSGKLDKLENDLIYRKTMDRVDALWCAMYEMKRYLYAI